jgi:16S rRNA (guanine966-N2)-methyltransferase
MIRVIGGRLKRQRLDTLDGTEVTRPTADRVRENLFNLLQGDVEDARVLDLFSGTGALGIEALSRGAKSCCFVEKNRDAAQVLKSNLQRLGLETSQVLVLLADVAEVVQDPGKFSLAGHAFDLVFADPPYKSPWYQGSLLKLEQSGLLSKFCTVALEMSRYDDHEGVLSADHGSSFVLRTQRDYGKTRIQLWQLGEVSHQD